MIDSFMHPRFWIATIALPMLLLVAGCQNQPANPGKGPQPAASTPDPAQAARLAELQKQRDALTAHFTLKSKNLPIPSYYHEAWGAYALDHEALLAGVDSNGVVFLIHCYDCTLPASMTRDPQHPNTSREIRCGDHPGDLRLDFGDVVNILPSHPQIEVLTWGLEQQIYRDPSETETLFCTDYFILSDSTDVARSLREGELKDLHFARECAGKEQRALQAVSPADQAAIRDCAKLGAVLQEMHALK